jgi:hypothetical protein
MATLALKPRVSAPDSQVYLSETGRLPRLGDEIAPWEYRGWLIPYVMGCHEAIESTGNRWGYWNEIMLTSALPDAPISHHKCHRSCWIAPLLIEMGYRVLQIRKYGSIEEDRGGL